MANYIVGLTGGIGSGKSTVAKRFAELGIEIVDADQVARDLVAPGTHALTRIAGHFGEDILADDGSLDRAKLRKRVFSNQDEKTWLNQLLHPAIREEMLNRCQQAPGRYCILEVPLLVENKLTALVNHVVVVDVDEQTQIERACARDNNTTEQVQRIMSAQASRTQRLDVADSIINNDCSLSSVKCQVNKLHDHLLEVAS